MARTLAPGNWVRLVAGSGNLHAWKLAPATFPIFRWTTNSVAIKQPSTKTCSSANLVACQLTCNFHHQKHVTAQRFTAKGPEFDFWEVDSARALFGPNVAISLYKFGGVLREGHFRRATEPMLPLKAICRVSWQEAKQVVQSRSVEGAGVIRWQMRWG